MVATARTLAPNTGEWQGSLEETVERIRASGGRAHAVACDVTVEADVKSTVERVRSEIGAVDVLINNAGLSVRGSIVDMSVRRLRPGDDGERAWAVPDVQVHCADND